MKHTKLYRKITAANQKVVIVEGTELTRCFLRVDGCRLVSANDLIGETYTVVQRGIDGHQFADRVWSKPKTEIDLHDRRPLVIYDYHYMDLERLDALFWKVYDRTCKTRLSVPVIFLEESNRHAHPTVLTSRHADRCAVIRDERKWKSATVSSPTQEFFDDPSTLTSEHAWRLLRTIHRNSCMDPKKTLRRIRRIPESA